MIRLILLLLVVLSLVSHTASAKQTLERAPTTRGLIRDASIVLAARDAVARAGIDCDVVSASLRGTDASGDRHLEVTCNDAPGYLIITGVNRDSAYSCLLLANQNERFERDGSSTRHSPLCLMNANRNLTQQFAYIAARSGIDCHVDEGRVVGLSEESNPTYEIGCRGVSGAWVEQKSTGWVTTDCLEVRSRGDICLFSSEQEELVSFSRWLAGSIAAICEPTRLISMGRNAAGLSYYEVACAAGSPVIIGLDRERRVGNVLSCAEAVHIGDGCRADYRTPER